jgi:hypothetical protein
MGEKSQKDPSLIAKGAYILCSGSISALIALVSLLLIFALVSLLASGTIPGVAIPDKIPNWGIAIILLLIYTIIVLPMKSLRYHLSPHKSYSLYRAHPTPKYGDATLWLAFFILLAWYVSEHKTGISASLESFPDWWRNFVDTAGPWFYR